jgi:hypothetical protein
MERKKGELSPPPETPAALDFLATIYLEEEGTGARLTASQRERFLVLVKNPGALETYARQGSTNEELAAILVLPVKAIEVFEPVLAKARALLNNRIRDQLLKAAERGEPTALSWLAERYLKEFA